MAEAVAALFHQTADPQINWVKETVFGVKDGAPILSGTHPVMEELMKGSFPKGVHVPSLALMPGTLTPPTAFADGRLPVLFEKSKADNTVIGNRTNDHQKAFMELIGMAALHLTYVPYASHGLSSGGLFQWKRIQALIVSTASMNRTIQIFPCTN